MVRYPEYSNPGLYLSGKHNPPSWSRCPGSNTNPCPCCGSLWLSPPSEVKNTTPGYCLDTNCNCCAKCSEGLPNKDLSSSQHYAKDEHRNGRTDGKREQCNPCLNPEENGQPIAPSKSTQCSTENPSGSPERNGQGYCQVSYIQPLPKPEVSSPFCENQRYAICVSNMMNPPLQCVKTCCNFCPPYDQYIPCPCMGLNCPFYRRPPCPFCMNPPCACQNAPMPIEVSKSLPNERPATSDKEVLCKPENLMILIGGKIQRREHDMRNGLQDHL